MPPEKITGVLMTELTYNLFEGKLDLKYAFTGNNGQQTHGFSRTTVWSPDTEQKFREFLESAKRDVLIKHGFPTEEEGQGHGTVQRQRPSQL